MTVPNRYGDDDTNRGDNGHQCRNGWLGTDLDDRPVPCLLCRPHLKSTSVIHDRAEIR